ncbi:aspartate aminotransferase family protein [Candidatus Chloroploca sp. M-50]|uniref:Putative [LysW]-aminoadipate semialdehyde transaminase n=1 Tax=Candidatus Chloroploca mongolica TaxID=2528176 RepID=A0ABS4DEB2_9CHLR|nr:aspartate aminotransferase family protein [Candidatus Chloroploca mongolica]MBP1467771.1 aspartate aminotransferase family protein [Candidatus Chloroploca mongolica]
MISNATIIATEQQHTSGLYPKRGVALIRGEGARLYDADGRVYIDCVGGQGAANLGHCHPAVVAAIQAQAATLMSCPEIFYNDQRAAYLQALAGVLPFPARIFLCNSGAEAIEAGLKFARLLSGRHEVVATMRGFHGRTMGALSATWEPKYREPFAPLVPGFAHVPYGDAEALDNRVNASTAAVLLEPVQGEGGVRPAPAGYLEAARTICDRHGALLLIDEVQTGFGRTGRLFALEHSGVVPDILLLAKSIAAGLPMGAVAIHERHGSLPGGAHGTTFGGNPLLCAAAHAALQAYHDEDLPRQAAEKGAWLLDRLTALHLPPVREIRGLGLLVGLELKTRVQPYLQALLDQGVLALPAGPNVLRLLPPLVIGYDDLEQVIAALQTVLS